MAGVHSVKGLNQLRALFSPTEKRAESYTDAVLSYQLSRARGSMAYADRRPINRR